MTKTKTKTTPRALYTIAQDIQSDWGERVTYSAVPYLHAMHQLNSLGSPYGVRDGRHVVQYFLANAGGWRGDTARAVKAELRAMLK